MGKKKNSLLQGTVELLILRALRDEDRHGWGIQQRINQISSETLDLKQGSLYPALIRLSDQDFIIDDWRVTENGRRAKYYSLTKTGRKKLEEEIDQWDRFAAAMKLFIETA